MTLKKISLAVFILGSLALLGVSGHLFGLNKTSIKESPKYKNLLSNYIVVKNKYQVCMVNDIYNPMADFRPFMVEVDSEKYYGCCPMCKAKLSNSNFFRVALDPLTKTPVKKSESFIVADKLHNGKTHYFASENNFLKWIEKRSK